MHVEIWAATVVAAFILATFGQARRHNAPMRFHVRSIRRSPDPRPTMAERDAAWIAANRRPFSDCTVGSLVPVVFEGYARVLHPAWTGHGVPVRWETAAKWAGRHVHALAQWDLLCRPKGEPSGPAPFVADPDTDGLPTQQLAALCALLATQTSTPNLCFVGVWEGYGRPAEPEWSAVPILRLEERTFLVCKGPLGLALAVGRDGANGGFGTERPSIFWPADRAWFVASDPDLDSTYLGGSNALIEAVLTHPDLEAWPATVDDLVAIGSDEINARQ